MIRVQKPADFSPRDPKGNVVPAHEHHPSVASFLSHIQGPGTGAPGRLQSPWIWVVEDNSSGTWRRVGEIRKFHNHHTEYVEDPAPAPAAAG